MVLFIRNLLLTCLGLMLLVGLMTIGFFAGLAALAAATLFWVYLLLRRKGILSGDGSNTGARSDRQVIEAEYTVIAEHEEREPEDRA